MRVADVIVRTPKWMAVPGILIAVAIAMQNPAGAGEPSTSVQTEYLMTLHVPLAPPLAIDQSLLVIGASTPGGWVEGPRIKGKLVGPAGDWLRVMPSGVLRQDVRGTIQTDTNDLIFMSYNSAIQCSKEQMDRLNAGEELKTGDCYFITAPTLVPIEKKESIRWLENLKQSTELLDVRLSLTARSRSVWSFCCPYAATVALECETLKIRQLNGEPVDLDDLVRLTKSMIG